jgi:hypothetical protein
MYQIFKIKLLTMKRIFTLSALVLTVAMVLGSCVKNYGGNTGINENYWLSKEQGEVVYSDAYCDYYVIETINGYTIVRSYGTYKPYEGAIVYGDFSYMGTKDIYNRSTGYVFSGTITDTWLDYYEAQDAMDYYCPLYYKGAERAFKKTTIVSNKKPAGK